MPSEVLTRAPEIRNPIQSLGYEKSTYIAARYLVDGHCLADDYIARFGKKIEPKGGFIFHKAPRAKITAKKAKRNLLN